MIIYKIENSINGKIYVGLTTKSLSNRIAGHIAENKSYVQKALNKYGIQSFRIAVIDSAESREVLCEKEKYWIQHYDCKAPNGYNLTDGGDGLINPSKSVRKAISKKVSIIMQGNQYRTGIPHSEATKKKISDTLKIVMNDPRVKAKLSLSHQGQIITEDQKKKISLANKGRKRKDAHLFSERILKHTRSEGYVNPMKGKKRPDLSERNRLNKGRKDSEQAKLNKSLASKGKPKAKEHVLHIAQAKAANKKGKKVC